MSKRRSKAQRFTHLSLGNWKNFVKVDIDLQGRAFLIGPNASGKSNFLDVFRFLRNIVAVGGGFQAAIGNRGNIKALRSYAARRYSDIKICVNIGNDENVSAWVYELIFSQDKQRQPVVKLERVEKNGVEILSRPSDDDISDPERLTQTHLEQVQANKEFREIADFFSSVRYLHIVPQLIREPDRSVTKIDDPFGGDFLKQIANTSEKTQKARLQRILKALRVAVPQLSEIKMERDKDSGKPHLMGMYQHWRPKAGWQNEEQFSDGTLRLLGLLWAALDGSGPLLLEEPELSLHPEVVSIIPQMFARMQRLSGRQFLVSTHSPDLLADEGIGLDETLLLIPGTEGTSVKLARDFDEIVELLAGGLTLAEAAMPFTKPRNVEQLALFAED